jgi:hypothetical protein
MNNGEIKFDMTRKEYATISETAYLLKRWKKYSIYAKSGSYNRTDNPVENLYSTASIYLYDYVSVSENFYNSTRETGGDEYFEEVNSYQRNHFTHKRSFFSLFDFTIFGGVGSTVTTTGTYKRCSQTINTTVGEDGINDGSSPVTITPVGNLNLIQSDNVINK